MTNVDPQRPPGDSAGATTPRAAPDPLDPALQPGTWALFLDVDGTLLGFQGRPEDVHLHHSLCRILHALDSGLDHAVALVSGRTLADRKSVV